MNGKAIADVIEAIGGVIVAIAIFTDFFADLGAALRAKYGAPPRRGEEPYDEET